jgi:hypothetical protein
MAPANGAVPAFDPRKRLLHEDMVVAVEVKRTVYIVVVGSVHARVEVGKVRSATSLGRSGWAWHWRWRWRWRRRRRWRRWWRRRRCWRRRRRRRCWRRTGRWVPALINARHQHDSRRRLLRDQRQLLRLHEAPEAIQHRSLAVVDGAADIAALLRGVGSDGWPCEVAAWIEQLRIVVKLADSVARWSCRCAPRGRGSSCCSSRPGAENGAGRGAQQQKQQQQNDAAHGAACSNVSVEELSFVGPIWVTRPAPRRSVAEP